MSADKKQVFFQILREEFAPALRQLGFLGSGSNFRRVRSEVIHVISIQGDKYGGQCSVNLGMHLSFLPVTWSNKLPEVKRMKEVDCEFRMRLTPDGFTDYWWEYGGLFDSSTKNVRHLLDTYIRHGEPRFSYFSTVEAISAMFGVADILEKDLLRGFGEMTPSRAALAMARIHSHLGKKDMAREFAVAGLNRLGCALALRPALERLAYEP